MIPVWTRENSDKIFSSHISREKSEITPLITSYSRRFYFRSTNLPPRHFGKSDNIVQRNGAGTRENFECRVVDTVGRRKVYGERLYLQRGTGNLVIEEQLTGQEVNCRRSVLRRTSDILVAAKRQKFRRRCHNKLSRSFFTRRLLQKSPASLNQGYGNELCRPDLRLWRLTAVIAGSVLTVEYYNTITWSIIKIVTVFMRSEFWPRDFCNEIMRFSNCFYII